MDDRYTPVRLAGWDHYSAVMLIFVLLCAPLLLFMPVASLHGGRVAAIITVGPLVLAILLVPFLRYEIIADRAYITVRRRLLGIAYSHERIALRNAWVQVWGTGDWGEEGDWPAKHYCMIGQERPYTQGTHIGMPKDAQRLEDFLKSELERLRRDK
jgi:hypothetical protein